MELSITEKEIETIAIERYSAHTYKKIKQSKVAIAGVGGLGSNIGIMLARIGVGELLLVDFDIVEASNINRQCYSIKHIGMQKTLALQEQIKEINPFIKIHCKDIKVTKDNVCKLFKDYKIVCEAFDSPETKSMFVNELLEKCTDTKVVSASGMAGYNSSNLIKTIKPINNLYVCGDLKNEVKKGQCLMAPRVQICAGHQVNMVLRLILGIEDV